MDEKIILMVEDNPDDTHLALRAFKDSRIANKIVVAHDGQEALNYLFGQGEHHGRNLNEMPWVVLLDVNLPKVSGIEVLRQIRANEHTAYVPVIMMSAAAEPSVVAASYQNGANSYVTKPSNFREFSEMIIQLRVYWLTHNVPPHFQ